MLVQFVRSAMLTLPILSTFNSSQNRIISCALSEVAPRLYRRPQRVIVVGEISGLWRWLRHVFVLVHVFVLASTTWFDRGGGADHVWHHSLTAALACFLSALALFAGADFFGIGFVCGRP